MKCCLLVSPSCASAQVFITCPDSSQELREIHSKQQLQKQKSIEAERLRQKEQERKSLELEKQKEETQR